MSKLADLQAQINDLIPRIEALESKNVTSGTLTFRLPEENDSFVDAQNGWKYKSALQHIYSELRQADKYDKYGEVPKTWHEIREWLNDVLEEAECPEV